MKNQVDYFDKIQKSFLKLKKEYPTSTLGKHIDMAFGDYRCLFSVTDKELSFALDKYISELSMDISPEYDVDAIVKDGETMFLESSIEDIGEEDKYFSDFE